MAVLSPGRARAGTSVLRNIELERNSRDLVEAWEPSLRSNRKPIMRLSDIGLRVSSARDIRMIAQLCSGYRTRARRVSSSTEERHEDMNGTGGYALPDLAYDYGALEPAISGEIMELHHGAHHAAYVRGANTAVEQLQEARA